VRATRQPPTARQQQLVASQCAADELPQNRNGGLTPLQQFEALVQAAKPCWSPMHEQPLDFWAEGDLWDDDRPLLAVRMTFVPGHRSSRCRIQGVIGKSVRDDSREFHRLLHRANAAVTFARAIFCDEERVILVRTDLDSSPRSGPDRDQVERRFTDLIRLIRHEALSSAMTKAGARCCVLATGGAASGREPGEP